MGYVDLNQNKRTDWVTPPDCQALLAKMGPLILDVCTVSENHMRAQQIYTPEVDGLKQSWDCGGLAWCNFPWSRETSGVWVEKACAEGDKLSLCQLCRTHFRAHTEGASCFRCPIDEEESERRGLEYGGTYLPGRQTEIVLLGPARPDTAWFRRLWGSADVIYFYKGRMTFHHPVSGLPCMHFSKKTKRWEKQPVPVPLLLAYWGANKQKFVEAFAPQGGVFAHPTTF